MASPGFRRLSTRSVVPALLIGWAALAIAGRSYAQSLVITDGGHALGTLAVGNYFSTTNAGAAGANISGDFAFTGDAAAASYVHTTYAAGLTYMQTVTFNLASGNQQKIFTRNDIGNVGAFLTGTFPDPPQNGYKYADGSTGLSGDTTPWYSTITPTAGSTQPANFFIDGSAVHHQFYDTPSIPFGVFGGQSGLTALLANQAGNITFETALVGVSSIPGNLQTGTYQASVLGDFTWGLKFAPLGGNNYTTSLIGVTQAVFGAPSAGFLSAFNRSGPQGTGTWNVSLATQVTPEPGAVTALLSASLAGAGLLARRRARRA